MQDTVPFTKKAVKAYLDQAITNWRRRRDYTVSGEEPSRVLCGHYIDAFQCVRTSLFGETLPTLKKDT